jgi:hypothetical protein
MQKLYIKGTNTTPEVTLSPAENKFMIKGVSSPEDVRDMYFPVLEWVTGFVNELLVSEKKQYTKESPLHFGTDLVYFNSTSAKFLYDIFVELKRLIPAGIPFIIDWFYDEEDIDLKEAGYDIALLVELDFVFIPKKK